MTSFLDLFEPIQKGNFGLTDEAIYKSIETDGNFIPIWGGNQEHNTIQRLVSENGKTKSSKPITIFDGEGIIISLDGSAGSMTRKKNQKFALNHHAGFFRVKRDLEETIDLDFFSLFYQHQFQDESVSEGSKTLTLKQIYSMDLNIPSYEVQKNILSKIIPILEKRQRIIELINHIRYVKNKTLSIDYKSYQSKDVPISDVVDYISGNSGLTEKMIYKKSQLDGQRYDVLSSSTEQETRLGKIPMCNINGRQLKIFEDREGLLVIRNGKAGTTIFLEKGKYTINDHAYILFLKDKCKYQMSIKWLMHQYHNVFLEYSSSSDNGTWNMTGFFENVVIDIPDYNEQRKIVEKYEKLETKEAEFKSAFKKINEIFLRTIV